MTGNGKLHKAISAHNVKEYLPKQEAKVHNDKELKLLDLALLWSCSHGIFDYGTFGLWGSFLSGGIFNGGQIISAMNVSNSQEKPFTNEELNLLRANLTNYHFLR